MAVLVQATVHVSAGIAPTVMLGHNGERKMYNYDQVQQAVDDAVDGDTIYLSDGQFSEFNVTKRIMVRGTGPDTTIQGSCTIYIEGTSPLTMPVLDALTFTGDVSVTSAYKQFSMRKCQLQNLKFIDGDFYDVKLDRCYIKQWLHLPENVKEFHCFNTKIYGLNPYNHTTGITYFSHCNIRQITNKITATFDNCVLRYCRAKVGSTSNYEVCISGSKLNYCIFPPVDNSISSSTNSKYLEIGATTTYANSFLYDTTVQFNNCKQVKIDAVNVVGYGSNSYLGDDDTMIGVYGSKTNAFRLTPELPRVVKHSVEVDAANKKLNVSLTLSK